MTDFESYVCLFIGGGLFGIGILLFLDQISKRDQKPKQFAFDKDAKQRPN